MILAGYSGAMTIAKTHWKALIYAAGNNNLSYSMATSLQALEQAELPANVDVFVQSFDAQGAAVRYRLQRDDQGGLVRTGQTQAPANSGDPASLSSFLDYAATASPEAPTFLILGGHGEGHRGTAIDDGHQDRLELSELEQALAARPVDTLLFDSCLMGSAEVADTLAGEAEVVVASADVVRTGAPLADYLRAAARSDDAASLGRNLVASRPAEFSTMSAVSTSASSELKQPLTQLSGELVKLDPAQLEELYEATRRGLDGAGNALFGYYSYPGFRLDLGDFCRQILARDSLSEALKAAAAATADATRGATLAHSAKDGEAASTGFTLALPLYRATEELELEEVAFWKATGWDKVIETFSRHDSRKAQGPSLTDLLRGLTTA